MIKVSDTYLDVLLRAGIKVKPDQLKVSKKAISDSITNNTYFHPGVSCIHSMPRARNYANEVIRISLTHLYGNTMDDDLACFEGHLDEGASGHSEVAAVVELVIAAQNLRLKELEAFAAINSFLETKYLLKAMTQEEADDLLGQHAALRVSSASSFHQFYSYCSKNDLSYDGVLDAVEGTTRRAFLDIIKDQAVNSLGLSLLEDQESAFFEMACKNPASLVLLESLYPYVTSATERGRYNPIFKMPLSLVKDLAKVNQIREGDITFVSQPLWERKRGSKKPPVPRILHVYPRLLDTPQFDETLSVLVNQGELPFRAAIETSAALEELP